MIICLLAARALRRRSFDAMQLSVHFFCGETRWRFKFEPKDTKNRRWIEVGAPQTLEPWLDRYLTEIRPALLLRMKRGVDPDRVAQANTALWLSTKGTPLTESA